MRDIMTKPAFRTVLGAFALIAALAPLNASAAQWWNVVPVESFEAATPWPVPDGPWITYDCSHTSIQGSWSTTTSKAQHGTKSVHVRGGTTPYNYNTCTWMRFGPFSLAGATDARLLFQYWLDSEVGYDNFRWEYSCAGVASWTGRAVSGNVGRWTGALLSLKPCAGRGLVNVQLFFQSDQSVNYQGVWVDTIRIQKFAEQP
jgi:hypothetical protein